MSKRKIKGEIIGTTKIHTEKNKKSLFSVSFVPPLCPLCSLQAIYNPLLTKLTSYLFVFPHVLKRFKETNK